MASNKNHAYIILGEVDRGNQRFVDSGISTNGDWERNIKEAKIKKIDHVVIFSFPDNYNMNERETQIHDECRKIAENHLKSKERYKCGIEKSLKIYQLMFNMWMHSRATSCGMYKIDTATGKPHIFKIVKVKV